MFVNSKHSLPFGVLSYEKCKKNSFAFGDIQSMGNVLAGINCSVKACDSQAVRYWLLTSETLVHCLFISC
jgi:hypothetical protein